MRLGARALWPVATLVAVGLTACGGGSERGASADSNSASSAQAAQITPAAREEAQQIFKTRCAACHGLTGHGDGPGAASLVPAPRDYHDTAWQDSVTDDEIEKAIVYGGAAVGRSPAMVGNPDLASKPGVVAALREIVRDFGKQP